MHKVLRIALCSAEGEVKNLTGAIADNSNEATLNPDNKTIKMTGPLSEIYTKALQVVYAKRDKVTGEPTMESQANDSILEAALKSVLVKEIPTNPSNEIHIEYTSEQPDTTVYATDADIHTGNRALAATGSLVANAASNPEARTILFIKDGDKESSNYNQGVVVDGTEVTSIRQATESICKSSGIELYYSFESFTKALGKGKPK